MRSALYTCLLLPAVRHSEVSGSAWMRSVLYTCVFVASCRQTFRDEREHLDEVCIVHVCLLLPAVRHSEVSGSAWMRSVLYTCVFVASCRQTFRGEMREHLVRHEVCIVHVCLLLPAVRHSRVFVASC